MGRGSLLAGIYFGQPKGFKESETGVRSGFNTMVYSTPEVRSHTSTRLAGSISHLPPGTPEIPFSLEAS